MTTNKQWSTKSHIFQPDDLIGEGAYSKVYRSNKFTQGSTETTAVKVYHKTSGSQQVIDHAKRQQSILKNVQSEFVCSYRQSIDTRSKFYMVQKLEEGETLDKLLDEKVRLQPKQVTEISKSILKGLQYLHSKSIMHRDLKPSNIIYNPQTNKAVLLDLGFATYFHKNDQKVLTSIVGTPNYMSPQILLGKKYNSLSDVWSFGVIVYEMLCGEVPFRGRNEKEILNAILAKNLVFRSSYNPTLEWIIVNCLKIDTRERLQWKDLFYWMNTGRLNVDQTKKKRNNNSSSLTGHKARKSLPGSISIDRDESLLLTNCECSIY